MKENQIILGIVVHICNPRFRRLRQGNHKFEDSLGSTSKQTSKKRKSAKQGQVFWVWQY
jgi:hypothetical protein